MELEATDSEKKQLSYATQFFGFTPDAFVDSIHVPSIEIVNEHLEVRAGLRITIQDHMVRSLAEY